MPADARFIAPAKLRESNHTMSLTSFSFYAAALSLLMSAAALAQTAPTPAPAAHPAPCVIPDWPNLQRYHDADVATAPPAANENRVVFMGDSITDAWKLDASFPGKPYLNRGISGQTTSQMVVRFRPDVLDLHPKVVVILAGINDIAENTGPISLEAIEGNFESMVDLAQQNGIRVVLSSVLPASNLPWRPAINPVDKVAQLNAWLKDLASKRGLVYLDYFTAMNDGHSGMKIAYQHDAVHPNTAGYAVMAPLAEQAITAALAEAAPAAKPRY
jgi:acyl-CoA thioesterase-1